MECWFLLHVYYGGRLSGGGMIGGNVGGLGSKDECGKGR